MMIKKKLIAMAAGLALCIGLMAGCGVADTASNDASAQTESSTTENIGNTQLSSEEESVSEDVANDNSEIEVVDEAEIDLEEGEAEGGL